MGSPNSGHPKKRRRLIVADYCCTGRDYSTHPHRNEIVFRPIPQRANRHLCTCRCADVRNDARFVKRNSQRVRCVENRASANEVIACTRERHPAPVRNRSLYSINIKDWSVKVQSLLNCSRSKCLIRRMPKASTAERKPDPTIHFVDRRQ